MRTLFILAFFLQLTACSSSISGQIRDVSNNAVLPMTIETGFNSGSITATNPETNERFHGTYKAARSRIKIISKNSDANDNNPVPAIAVLNGSAGTIITCDMDIDPGLRPTGIGRCQDNKNNNYVVDF